VCWILEENPILCAESTLHGYDLALRKESFVQIHNKKSVNVIYNIFLKCGYQFYIYFVYPLFNTVESP